MDKKKGAYATASVSKKIKMTVIPFFLGLALISFITTFVMLVIISNYAADMLSSEAANDVKTVSMQLAAVALLVFGGVVAVATIKIVSILHKSVGKPLLELTFKAKRVNEGINELGIEMSNDTKDEIDLINSVYFKIAEQLKVHADDVTKLSGLTEKFENSANFDALTGVYNRRHFTELVEKHVVRAAMKNEQTYVFMLDLDHFKKVNDTYGHTAGDEVLKIIAGRIKDTVRPYDLFGRYGGEEFIMFLSVNEAESALNFAERIRTIVQEEPVHFEDIDIPITASIGVAQAAPDVSYENAVKLADKALYKAKGNGRNRVEIYGKSNNESE